MEVSYIKDGNQNIMLMENVEVDMKDYKLQMIINNKIEGLISLSVASIDNKKIIKYNISSRTSFSNMFTRKHMTGKELYSFIKELKELGERLKEYLINVNNIIFDVEYIFFNRQIGRYEFCYSVEEKGELYIKLRDLFDKMLEFIDHNDKEAVLIAYGIQQLTISEDFTLQDILQCAYNNIQEYKKEQIEESFEPENIVHMQESSKEPEKKKSLFERIINIMSKRDRYKTEDEFNYLKQEENKIVAEQQEYYSEDIDDKTIVLSVPQEVKGITLSAVDTQIPIEIIPNHFPYVIGKSIKSCDFCIDSAVISRVHLKISQELDAYTIEDLSSTNGTFLNGEKLREHQIYFIEAGDKVTLANLNFLVEETLAG